MLRHTGVQKNITKCHMVEGGGLNQLNKGHV